MTQWNTEVKNSYEIWWYKSVEELASEVEKKNKDLAEKIRTNAKKQILEEWKDWRISLKEELTPDDEKALREALPDSDVQSYFNEAIISQDESKNQNNGFVLDNIEEKWSSVMSKIENWWKNLTNWWDKKIGQLEKIWTSFSEWFDKFTDSLFSWKFTDSYKILWMIFSSWWFSLEKWEKMKKDEEDNKNWENSDLKDKWKEIARNSEYIAWARILYMIGWKELKDKSNGNLFSQQISNVTFNDLIEEEKNPKWIWERLWKKVWLIDNANNDSEILASIEILKKSENFINKLIWKQFPDWKKSNKIWEIVKLINKSWWWAIDKIYSNLENIKISSISDVADIIPQIMKDCELKVKDNWEIDYWVYENNSIIWKIKWISNDWKIKLLSSSVLNVTTDDNSKNAELNLAWSTEINSPDRLFIRELYEYKNKLIPNIINFFPQWEKQNWIEFFKNKWFNLKELTELYLFTWWKTNPWEFNDLEYALFIMKTAWILNKDKDHWCAWSFLGTFADEFNNSTDFTIPPNVKLIINNLISKAWEKVANDMKWITISALKFCSTETMIKAWVIIWWIIIVTSKFKYVKWIATWVVFTSIGWKLYDLISSDPGWSKYLKENWINSKEKAIEDLNNSNN